MRSEELDELERRHSLGAGKSAYARELIEEDLRHLITELRAAQEREVRHLALISQMSKESISPMEADELRGQIASLIAEVGSLRMEARELKSERDDSHRGGDW